MNKKHLFYRGQSVKLKGLDKQEDNHPYMKVTNFIYAVDENGRLKKSDKGGHMLAGIRTGWFTENKQWIEKEWHSTFLEPAEKDSKFALSEAVEALVKEGKLKMADELKQLIKNYEI